MFGSNSSSSDQWISISDMMSGLMMVFLFIAISYMINVVKEKDKIKEIAVTYNRLQTDLYSDLNEEFKEDLEKWNAEIDRQSLAVRFDSPDVLFETGSSTLRPSFKQILSDFFPRYVSILAAKKYREDIEEIRIEGHTSSDWSTEVSADFAYLLNMELSQGRTRSVLDYTLGLREIRSEREWVKSCLTANGLSSSKLIFVDGKEDRALSRRVEFRVRTNAERRIVKIVSE